MNFDILLFSHVVDFDHSINALFVLMLSSDPKIQESNPQAIFASIVLATILYYNWVNIKEWVLYSLSTVNLLLHCGITLHNPLFWPLFCLVCFFSSGCWIGSLWFVWLQCSMPTKLRPVITSCPVVIFSIPIVFGVGECHHIGAGLGLGAGVSIHVSGIRHGGGIEGDNSCGVGCRVLMSKRHRLSFSVIFWCWQCYCWAIGNHDYVSIFVANC